MNIAIFRKYFSGRIEKSLLIHYYSVHVLKQEHRIQVPTLGSGELDRG